jgi:ABC-type antimicrobial peptide transport system permease subunit
LSLFTIFNTILMSVLERTREFAVLLALGTSPWRLRAQILVESLFLGLLGAGVGLLIGGSAAYALQIHGFDLSQLYEGGMDISGFTIDARVFAEVTPGLLIQLGSLVVAAVVFTSLLAMRRISRIHVATVLR